MSGKVEGIQMDRQTYMKTILPIGLCYSVTLWLGNAAYLYLSVSFIQMLKALMPVSVFSIGSIFGTEKFESSIFINMFLITIGVAIASMGEMNFNTTGLLLQLGSIVCESIRLVLVQKLLQSRGLKLNPITTLYYVAPCCFVFLLIPFSFIEYEKIMSDGNLVVNPLVMLGNALVAFCTCFYD